MKYLKYIFCTFAALWFPVSVLAAVLRIESLSKIIERLGEAPLYAALIGSILMLIDLWQSGKTNDEKIWWSALGLFLFPIVAPAYWFGYGLKNQKHNSKQVGAFNGS